ncbi:hypothetical protein HispidOSU_002913 [Sigmodon hispidus]
MAEALGSCGLHGAGPHQGPVSGIVNQGTVALCSPCPGLSNLVCADLSWTGRFRAPPEARGPRPFGGCHGDGAVYQLVAAKHRRRMELSCEIRERKGNPGHVQRQELEGASHNSVLFPQVCPHAPALPAFS